jgi:hypothetical protein
MLSTLLLVGCALITKQKDFDVDLPLLTDEATAEAAEPLPMELKLYDERSSWYLPAVVDAELWGPLLLADAIARRDLGDGFLVVTATALELDAEPGYLTIRYSLSTEEGFGRYTMSAPQAELAPGSCDLTVDESTTPDQHADELLDCLRDWIDANGAPELLGIEAEVIDTDLADYALTLDLSLSTDRPAEVTCTGRLGVTEELQAESDNVDFNTLELGGYAVPLDHGMRFVAFENTFDGASPDPTAGGTTAASLSAGAGTWVGQEVPLEEALPSGADLSGVAPIDYFPGGNSQWREASVASLELPDGYVEACWVGLHDEEPNEALVHFTLVGEGHYDGRE